MGPDGLPPKLFKGLSNKLDILFEAPSACKELFWGPCYFLFISLLPDTVSSCSSLFADDCLPYIDK